MLFVGCILPLYKTSLMNGYKIKIVKNTNHCFSVNYLELLANILIGGTVIIFVLSHVYVIILGQLILFVILYLKWFIGQRLQGVFLIRQKMFFPAIIPLLHPCLVMTGRMFCDCCI